MHVQRALRIFGLRAKIKGYGTRLKEALGRGRSRDAMMHQIFVHFSSPCSDPQWVIDQIMENYDSSQYSETRIYSLIQHYRKTIVDSIDPQASIYIDSPYLTDESHCHRICESLPYCGKDTGYLSEEEVLQLLALTEGIHEEDTFIIHGAFVGACVDHFAMQICALKLFQQYHIPKFLNGTDNQKRLLLSSEEEHAMELYYNKLQLPKIANLQYGVVFDIYNARSRSQYQQFISAMTGDSTYIFP